MLRLISVLGLCLLSFATLSSASEPSEDEVLLDEARNFDGNFLTNNGAYLVTLNTTLAIAYIALFAFGLLAALYLSARFDDETGYGSSGGGYGGGNSGGGGGYGSSGSGSSNYNHRSKRALDGGKKLTDNLETSS